MSKIVDRAGVWLINTAQFPLHDSQSNTRFEPGEPTKAALTQFVKDQPTIVRCADPSADLTTKEQEKLQSQVETDEKERLAREAAAEQAMKLAAVQTNTDAALTAAVAPAAPAEGS